MADLLAQVPYPGSWIVTGSERDFDWIGPRSTLPGLGFVFTAFDRFIPFTRWLTAIRRMLGAGGDNMSGAMVLDLVECGKSIKTRDMTLKPVGNNRFVGERNIHGTIHRMELTVISPTEMEERWTWSISPDEAPPGVIDPEARARAEAKGIDLSGRFLMESDDKPMRWKFTGDENAAVEELADCCAAIWLSYLKQTTYRDGYSDETLLAEAKANKWTYDQYTGVVSARGNAVRELAKAHSLQTFHDAMFPFLEALVVAHNGKAPTYETAGSTDSSGNVTVAPGKHAVQKQSILEHEWVHERQVEEFEESWLASESDYPTSQAEWEAKLRTEPDPDYYTTIEVEAYTAGIKVYEDWLRANCETFGALVPGE